MAHLKKRIPAQGLCDQRNATTRIFSNPADKRAFNEPAVNARSRCPCSQLAYQWISKDTPGTMSTKGLALSGTLALGRFIDAFSKRGVSMDGFGQLRYSTALL